MDAAFFDPNDGAQALRSVRGLGRAHTRSAPMSNRLSEADFEDEVNSCLPRLTQIARRVSGNEEIANDAVQQALVRASRAWGKFDNRSEVSTWLTRIVIRAVRRLFADQKRRRMRTNSISFGDSVAGLSEPKSPSHQGPAQQAMQEELNALIRQAVSELPDRQREIFALITWQGMNAAAVAELLKIKEQNVYAHLHAARVKLRPRLQQYVDSREGES